MNKNLHRIIFNANRGQLMVVAETASAQGKAGSGETATSGGGSASRFPAAGSSPLRLALAAAFGLVMWMQPALQDAHAQIIADPSAPASQRPTILPTANGLPQVNIQTPSAAGVSRNTYTQFDINAQGAILNNSRTNTPTQLGGYVQGNPWLAAGSARVILNEVNSSNPSQLRGYIEVAGQRAEVIIANPAGINVNGGGVLNASRVTLTTGTPIFNGGSLDAYRVQGGNITINGLGLDTSTTDYTAILARAVQVNAGIFGRELHITTGANLIDANAGNATAIAGSGPAPTYAIDVASIGGMYAGKIFLVGTESGLGVRNAGTLGASAGELVIQANGWLTNTGAIQAAGNLQVTTVGNLTNSSLIAAQGDANLQAVGTGAQLSSAGAGAVIASGLKGDGTLATSGNLNVSAADSVMLAGQVVSAGDTAISGTQVGLAETRVSAQGMSVTATAGELDVSLARITAQGLLNLNAPQTLRTDGATLSANQLKLSANNLSNVGGTIGQTGHGNAIIRATGTVDNTSGKIASNGNTSLNANSLTNAGGTLQTTGTADLTLAVTGAFNNDATSQVSSAGNITLTAGSLTNAGKLQSAAALTVTAPIIDNAASAELTGVTTRITASSTLTNRGLIDGQTTGVDAGTLNNIGTGRIYGDTLSIAAATLNNTAETIAGVTSAPVIAARERLDIGVATLNNDKGALIFSAGSGAAALNIGGSLDANRQATGFAGTINNSGGTIESLGGLAISASQINNTNPDFAYTVQFAPGANAREYVTAQGLYTNTDVGWVVFGDKFLAAAHGGYQFGGVKGKLVLVGSAYANPVYQAYYSGADAYTAESVISGGNGDSAGPDTLVPASFNYDASSAVWQVFGINAPTGANPGPKPAGYTNGGDVFVPPTQQQLDAWAAAAAPWIALQAQIDAMRASVNGSAISFDGFRDFNQSNPSATITQSTPGRIVSAGNMTLNAQVGLLNDQSQIIAGGVLSVTGQALENRARTTLVNAQRTGIAYAWSNYNEGCGSALKGCDYNYDAYRDSAYNQPVPQTLTLNVSQSRSQVAPASQGLASGTQLAVATVAGGTAAAPTAPVIVLPASSLFKTNPNPAANFLVETDARFTNLRQWLSSDYMLAAISLDPTVTQKRLGDGFYEQRLVREQVAQLTGQRFLANYTSDEAQYQALMNAGVTYAQAFNLHPGIALTAAQIAQLTSDIVWLVEQTVTLPDGTVTKALVPQVYVGVKPGDIDGKGVLLAGREVNINLSGDLSNSGTIAGRQVMSLTAENVQNIGGRITGDAVTVAARNDINVIGGQIDAVNSLTALAGRDINIVTTTSTASNRTGGLGTGGAATTVNASSNNTFSMTGIDRVAGLYVTGNTTGTAGTLVASAGRDLNVIAGVIGNNSTSGSTTLAAGNNINLATVTTASSSDQRRGDDDFVSDAQTKEVGSQIQAAGTLRLAAGNDLNARAANVQATGDLTATAGKDINLTAGRQTNSFGFGMTTSESDLFSSTSTKERRTTTQDKAIGTSLGGKTVTLASGQDIKVQGSSVIGDTGTTLAAGRNIAIEAAQNASTSTSFFEKKESGLLDGGDFGITIGTREQSNDQKNRGTAAAASTVGAINGNVSVAANKVYQQMGSDVLAPNGSININAATVNITEARETTRAETEQKFKQSGITIALSSPILSALQTAENVGQAIGNTSDSRMQALGVAAAGFNGYNTYKSLLDTNGKLSPEKAASISVNISYGTSESQSNSTATGNTSRGSTLNAGQDINIKASGAGQDSNVLVQGSTVNAARDLSLFADNQVRLIAARNEATQTSSNSSSSSSFGVSFGIGAGGPSFGVNASASQGQGTGNGQDTSYTNTQANAGKTVSIQSGGNTDLIGAVVTANTVKVDVGGNLTIQSLQDTSTYTSQQSSGGGSISFGTDSFLPVGGGISAGKSNIDSNFQSVGQQSGIQAGDGGFQVNVNSNTALTGSVIASTQAAVDAGKNSFTTGGTLTTTDLQNSAEYKGTGYNVGASVGMGKDTKGNDITTPGGSFGFGSDSGSASSTTTAGISGIAGNTAVRTGDAATGIRKIFDAEKVQKEIDAQIAITAAFGQQASKAIGDFAAQKMQERDGLLLQASLATGDEKTRLEQEAQALNDNWGDYGTLRLLAHTVVGGLTGGANGALGAAAGTLAAPAVAGALDDAGITGPLASTLTALASTAAGALAGGGLTGGSTAFNEVTNNYLGPHELKSAIDACTKAANPRSCLASIGNTYAAPSDAKNQAIQLACVNTGGSAECSSAQKVVEADIAGLKAYALTLNPANELDAAKLKITYSQIVQAQYQLAQSVNMDGGGIISFEKMTPAERMDLGFALGVALDGSVAMARKAVSDVLNSLAASRAGLVKGANGSATNGTVLVPGSGSTPAITKGGTVELFTDAGGPKVPGAVGVGPTDPGAVATNAMNMPNIPSNSQAVVVANNPYIPKPAGGTFSMMDYLPEATRITQPGGEIVINGNAANKYFSNMPTNAQLDALGLEVKYQGPILPEYQGASYATTQGKEIRPSTMQTIVFVKKK